MRLITRLSVTNCLTARARTGIFCLTFLFLICPVVIDSRLLGENLDPSTGLPYVRVKWKQDFEGLIHQEFLVKDARIVEVSEYSGVLMDSQGHIAVYIPDPLKLSSPQGSFSVTDGKGVDFSAELLGVDQRMSLAFLRAVIPGEIQAVFGQDISGNTFSVVSWNGSEWIRNRFKLIEAVSNKFGPVVTIKAVNSAKEYKLPGGAGNKYELRSSFILDGEDRLLGLGVSASSKGLSRSTMEFKVFPVKTVRESLQMLRKKEGGVLESGWIGVYIDAADSGVRVSRVVPESPAFGAGIMAGDTIVALNREPLVKVEDFIQAVKWIGPENDLKLTVERDTSSKEYEVILGRSPVYKKPAYEWALDIPRLFDKPGQLSQNVRFRPVPTYQRRSMGIQVGTLTSQLARYFQSPTGKGLLVEAVESDSLAEQIGLKAGDVLIRIDTTILKSSSDLVKIMDAYHEPVVLSFVRDGKVIKQKVLFR